MAYDLDGLYAQLKELENSALITVPEVQETVEVGLIDPKEGTFGWTVPTLDQEQVIPPNPRIGQKTNEFINWTVGVVATQAVDLRLKFGIIPQSRRPVAEARIAGAAARLPGGRVVSPITQWNGGVTISGYPTVSSTADEITIDVGFACSTILDDPNLTPAVTKFVATINFLDHDPIDVDFFVLRPPVLGAGAFTIPALPMTIVYAPPQGKTAQNKQSYSDEETLTRTVSSSLTTSTTTKTAQAYSASDLFAKASAAIASVVAIVGTGGAAGAGASVVGALEELGEAVFGPIKQDNDSIADALGKAKTMVSNYASLVGQFEPSSSSSNQVEVTTTDDHSVTLSFSSLNEYESEQGLGPGDGDRIVYMSNVRVVWMAIGGEVNIVILGYDGIGANGAHDLLAELRSLQAGGTPTIGLDETTIAYLLGVDALVAHPRSGRRPAGGDVAVHLGPPVIRPPRFIPAVPPGRHGTGTGTGGDNFLAAYDTTVDQSETTTTTTTTVTDVKPSWIPVLFGLADNQETTTTTTLTTSQTTDNRTDDKTSCQVTLYSTGLDDPYDVKLFYDNTFGTYVILDASSPLLQGGAGVEEVALAD